MRKADSAKVLARLHEIGFIKIKNNKIYVTKKFENHVKKELKKRREKPV